MSPSLNALRSCSAQPGSHSQAEPLLFAALRDIHVQHVVRLMSCILANRSGANSVPDLLLDAIGIAHVT
eukprot:9248450-Karenia_brevis.AAC.1